MVTDPAPLRAGEIRFCKIDLSRFHTSSVLLAAIAPLSVKYGKIAASTKEFA